MNGGSGIGATAPMSGGRGATSVPARQRRRDHRRADADERCSAHRDRARRRHGAAVMSIRVVATAFPPRPSPTAISMVTAEPSQPAASVTVAAG